MSTSLLEYQSIKPQKILIHISLKQSFIQVYSVAGERL